MRVMCLVFWVGKLGEGDLRRRIFYRARIGQRGDQLVIGQRLEGSLGHREFNLEDLEHHVLGQGGRDSLELIVVPFDLGLDGERDLHAVQGSADLAAGLAFSLELSLELGAKALSQDLFVELEVGLQGGHRFQHVVVGELELSRGSISGVGVHCRFWRKGDSP